MKTHAFALAAMFCLGACGREAPAPAPDIAATGLHGITAGFLAAAQVGAGDPLASWVRYGMNETSTSSSRTVLLPRAGTYALAIADTRTLLPLATGGGPVGPAPGGPDDRGEHCPPTARSRGRQPRS